MYFDTKPNATENDIKFYERRNKENKINKQRGFNGNKKKVKVTGMKGNEEEKEEECEKEKKMKKKP